MTYQNSQNQLRALEQNGFTIDYTNSSRFPWLGFGNIPSDSTMIPSIEGFLDRKSELWSKYCSLIGEGLEPLTAACRYHQELAQLGRDVVAWSRSLGFVQGVRHASERLDEIIRER